ncbi:MAG: VOC family protein [Chloroflexota bacterium]|nr:VOC family protein [Chloroflexota bacterium]
MIVPQLQSVFVFVRDLDRALFFYCGTLGLPLRRQWAGGAEVGGGGATLMLAVADADTAPEATGRATGITFAVDRGTYDALAARGVGGAHPIHYPWGTLAIMTDPDGNEFALLAPAAVARAEEPAPRPIPAIHASFRPRPRLRGNAS